MRGERGEYPSNFFNISILPSRWPHGRQWDQEDVRTLILWVIRPPVIRSRVDMLLIIPSEAGVTHSPLSCWKSLSLLPAILRVPSLSRFSVLSFLLPPPWQLKTLCWHWMLHPKRANNPYRFPSWFERDAHFKTSANNTCHNQDWQTLGRSCKNLSPHITSVFGACDRSEDRCVPHGANSFWQYIAVCLVLLSTPIWYERELEHCQSHDSCVFPCSCLVMSLVLPGCRWTRVLSNTKLTTLQETIFDSLGELIFL